MFEDYNQPQQTINPSSELGTPQTPSVPDQEPHTPETLKPNRRKSIIIGIIIFAILIVLVAGALVGYNYLTNKNKNTNITVNANIEANTNMAINQNINANLNANANINLNSNINLNASTNNNINAGVNTNENTNVNTAMIDSDNDGLSDYDEFLYGTDKNKTDTDGDGYSDKVEIDKFYSPVGQGRMVLENFKTYCRNIMPTTDTDKNFSNDEVVSICDNGAEIFDPILQLLINNDLENAQLKLDNSKNNVKNMCDTLFNISVQKSSSCFGDLWLIFDSFSLYLNRGGSYD